MGQNEMKLHETMSERTHTEPERAKQQTENKFGGEKTSFNESVVKFGMCHVS